VRRRADPELPAKKSRASSRGDSALAAFIGAGAVAATFLALTIAEGRRPLRLTRESRPRRVARNLTMAALSGLAVTLVGRPLENRILERAARANLGLLRVVRLPRPVRIAAGVLLLDYTLWWWHWLNHESPALWRFHLVHHVDRDLDASTGVRFHFGEMLLSVGWRMAQIRVLGVDREALALWQKLLIVSILFHHSNLRLSEGWEEKLVKVIVTPRMHGIHHSDVAAETNSNWSSLLSVWDRLHGTYRSQPRQDDINIGVPAFRRPADVTLGEILAIPFRTQGDDWSDSTREAEKRLR
jgi:sterol desaturase/sphingolipid hydroxylase (fatty acid hydroxylase superfamily)